MANSKVIHDSFIDSLWFIIGKKLSISDLLKPKGRLFIVQVTLASPSFTTWSVLNTERVVSLYSRQT